eukprot:85340_1
MCTCDSTGQHRIDSTTTPRPYKQFKQNQIFSYQNHLSFLFFYKIYFIFSIISYCLNRAPYDPAESHAQTQITSFLSIHFFHYSARKRTQIQSQNNQKQTTISYNFLSLNKIKSFHIKINHFYSFFGV